METKTTHHYSPPKRNSKHPRYNYYPKNWTNEIDKNELFDQTSNNSTSTPDYWSGTSHPTSQPMDTLISLIINVVAQMLPTMVHDYCN